MPIQEVVEATGSAEVMGSVVFPDIPGIRTGFGENPLMATWKDGPHFMDPDADLDASDQNTVPTQVRSFLDDTVSRRTLLTGGVVAGIGLTLGKNLLSPDAADAADAADVPALDGETSTEWPPKERYKNVKLIDTATLHVDDKLSQTTDSPPRITHIDGLGYNTYPDEFKDIPKDPKNPRDMLDYAYLKLCASLFHNMEEYASLPPRPLDNTELFDNAFARRKKNNLELPPRGKVSDYLKILKKNDGEGKFQVWAFDENDPSGINETLTEVDPTKGLDVILIADQPHNVMSVMDLQSGEPSYGYTLRVIDGKMQIGLYIRDRSYATSYRSTGKHIDLSYSAILCYAMERILMFGGRNELMQQFDSPYLTKRNQTPGFALFPDLASLLLGPIAQDGYYNVAPVLEVSSPEIYRDTR